MKFARPPVLFAAALKPLCLLVCLIAPSVVGADWLPTTSSRAVYGDQDSSRQLVIGSVTNSPSYNFGQMKKLSLYMLDRLRDFGIDAVMVVTTDSHDTMVQLLRDGHVHWVAATPYSALLYEREAGAEFTLTKKSAGRGAYRSVFFTRKDSAISTLGDLKGRVIAFEKPGSTSAYFLPAMELIGAGYRLIRLDSPRARPPDDAIGYVFSGDEVNSSTWVHKRIAAAAAFSDVDWDSDWRMPDAFRRDMKIFHQTSQVPRSLEVMGPGLDPLLRTQITSSLLALNDHEDATDILSGYYRASDFSPLNDQQRQALDDIRAAMTRFDQHVATETSPQVSGR